MSEAKNSTHATSLERVIPDELTSAETTGSETLKLHLDRYEFAKKNLVPGAVLDLASGVGYGTALLATSSEITSAVGVDISSEAVQYAVRHYQRERVRYLCSPALEFKPEEGFENVVSLETIEHVDHPHDVFHHLVSLVKPGGRLIASVPVTPSVDANPHHRSNFSRRTFLRLGSTNGLEHVKSLAQTQPFNPLAVLTRREKRTADLRTGIAGFYLRHPSHLVLRFWSILRDGFANKYLTVVWEKPRSTV